MRGKKKEYRKIDRGQLCFCHTFISERLGEQIVQFGVILTHRDPSKGKVRFREPLPCPGISVSWMSGIWQWGKARDHLWQKVVDLTSKPSGVLITSTDKDFIFKVSLLSSFIFEEIFPLHCWEVVCTAEMTFFRLR